MKEIFQIREILIVFYRKNDKWINPILKFLFGILIFALINSFGYVKDFSEPLIIIIMGILSVVLPISLTTFLMILMIITQLLSVSLELSVIVGIVLLCILLFYIRIFQKESILIFGLILAYYFKIPYFAVIIGAMFLGISSIAPVAIGTFVWNMIPTVNEIAKSGGTDLSNLISKDLLEIPNEFARVYSLFLDSIKLDQTWAVSIVIFSMTTIVIYIILQMQINYSHYIAIGIGSLLNILGFIFAGLVVYMDIDILGIIVSTLVCGMLACVVEFFSRVLDYSSAEKVQFEDDNNYYYVKVIPKVSLKKQKSSKVK